MATTFSFTPATSNGSGGYNWNVDANWGTSAYPFGQNSVALIDGTSTSTLVLNFAINSFGGLSAVEMSDPSATLSLGSNSVTLKDNFSVSGTSPDLTGTPLVETAGTITDAGGTIIADNNATGTPVVGGGTITIDGVLTGFGNIQGIFAGTGAVTASGGTFELVNGIVSTTNTFDIGTAASSILRLDSTVASGAAIDFNGASSGVLQIEDDTGFSGTIAGLNVGTSATAPTGNYIDVNANVTASLSGNTILLSDGATLALGGSLPGGTYVMTAADGTLGGTDVFLTTVCYAAGTRLLTDQGEIEVERIVEGTRVITLRGDQHVPMPVTWVGQMRVRLAGHPHPAGAAPIRIRRHAFAENVPHRDLLVSPDHCLFIDGKLFVARGLVNGMTIEQDFSCPVVQYYHIETERHAVVLAEGLPAETYLDTGNRAYFDNSGLVLMLYPQFQVNATLRCWAEDACAPLADTPAEREPVWRRLAERASALGYATAATEVTMDPGLRLLAGGREFAPVTMDHDRYTFVVPRDLSQVTLLSRTACPARERPWIEDQRQLGVAIRGIVLRGEGDLQVLSADHPSLCRGWWRAEHEDGNLWRWSDGAGVIPLPFPARTIEIQLTGMVPYPSVHAGAQAA
jgi:hypothetical protein